VHITAVPKTNIYIDRLQGYKDALKDHHISFKNEHIIISNFSQESGVSAAEVILQMKRLPDGAFVANDNCAAGCMTALKHSGIRIPEDIAFAGFNNDPVSTVVEPRLTTISYRGYEMGEVAAQNLIHRLNGIATGHSNNTIMLETELIIRESSKRVNRQS
jgi:LacI family transcriptional regulator